jgi:Domain of unknown function (DUF4864)
MWKRILALLILLGALVAGVYLWGTKLTAEPVKVIQSQLDAINANDIPAAYGYFAPELRAKFSLEQYRAAVEKFSAVLKTHQASFPFRQLYWRGGTMFLERNAQTPPGGGFPRLSDSFLNGTLHADQTLDNVALVRGTLVAPGGKAVKVYYLLMEEPDAATGKDRWVILDFALGKW